jgi:hypothetical protein
VYVNGDINGENRQGETKPVLRSSMRRHPLRLATAILLLLAGSLQSQQTPPPYKNASLAVEARVKDLLGRMTLEEDEVVQLYFRMR